MKSADFQQIKRVFQLAVKVAPEGRAEFLDKECGDNKNLRHEVERILDAEDSKLINKGKAKEAVKLLETAKLYERSIRAGFWPQYLGGEAYLELKDCEKAKAEFQKILDNQGLAPFLPLYPLAQLGKTRAMKDKKEYEKFFEIWKEADED